MKITDQEWKNRSEEIAIYGKCPLRKNGACLALELTKADDVTCQLDETCTKVGGITVLREEV